MIQATRALIRAANFDHGFAERAETDVLVWSHAAVCLACIVPGVLAARYRQSLLAALLLAAAFLPLAQLMAATALSGSASLLPEILSGASYVCSHLCIVEVTLLFLCSSRVKALCEPSETPQLTIALRALALVVAWASTGHWALQSADRDRLSVVLDQLLITAGFVSFWLCSGPGRRMLGRQVFFHGAFWRQLPALVSPLVLLVLLAAVQSSAHTPQALAVHAALQGTAAVLAGFAISSAMSATASQAEEGSPCIHWILCGSIVILAPVLMLAVLSDIWEHPERFPPTLSMAATTQVGGFVLTASAVPLLALSLVSIEIMASVPPEGAASGALSVMGLQPVTAKKCHRVGCQLARFGMALCLAAEVFTEKDKLGQILHTGFAMLMFASYWLATLFTGVGADLASSNGKARAFIAACILGGMVTHLALFLIVNRWVGHTYVPNRWIYPPRVLNIAYGFSEYALLVLIASYPMTWIPEAVSWQRNGYSVDKRLLSSSSLT